MNCELLQHQGGKEGSARKIQGRTASELEGEFGNSGCQSIQESVNNMKRCIETKMEEEDVVFRFGIVEAAA